MSSESSGKGKLAEFVPNHVLCDEYGHMAPTVVDGYGQPHHIGNDSGLA